jgi:DNA-binding NarL/FixJ family response regulator
MRRKIQHPKIWNIGSGGRLGIRTMTHAHVEKPMKTRPRILLADDSPAVLTGICRLLERKFKIVGTVQDGLALLSAVKKLNPDVVITDIMMPGLSGLDAVRRLNKMPQVKVRSILLTVLNDPSLADEARAAGVMGYVTKVSADRDLVEAINTVLAGEFYLSPILRSQNPGKKDSNLKPDYADS